MNAPDARERAGEHEPPQQGEPFVGARDFPPAEMRWPPPTAAQRGQRTPSYGPRRRALAWLAIFVALALALARWLR